MRFAILMLALATAFSLAALPCQAGDNADAVMGLSMIEVSGDTLSYEVLVGSAVETRVVELWFTMPDGLEFLTWDNGDLLSDALRIGPYPLPTGGVLISLATKGSHTITESSWEVGTARFLRTGEDATEPSLSRVSLVDNNFGQDFIVTAESPVRPSPAAQLQIPLPKNFALRRISPNPMSSHTLVSFEIPRPGSNVTIRVYDVQGRVVRTVAAGNRAPGYYTQSWDLTDDHGRRVAPGVYFCRMEAGSFRDTKKLVLLR